MSHFLWVKQAPPPCWSRVVSLGRAAPSGVPSFRTALVQPGKDRNNPHCHLLVRDRDVVSGQRVVMFSAGAKEIQMRTAKGQSPPTTLRMIRELWEVHANRALEAAGRPERVDRRRLVDQGIYRLAQIHEGPNIRAMHARGAKPVSKERVQPSRVYRKKGTPAKRTVRYQEIDGGRTRVEYNAALKNNGALSLTEIARIKQRVPNSRPTAGLDHSRVR